MDIIGILSASVAVIAAYIAYHSLREQRRITRWSNNYSRLADTEAMANNCHSILELHGITAEDLEVCDARVEEVVYLLQSFRAGQEWSRISGNKEHSLSPYRIHMLKQRKVACIWKNVLREKMVFDSAFVKSVDQYLEKSYNNQLNKDASP